MFRRRAHQKGCDLPTSRRNALADGSVLAQVHKCAGRMSLLAKTFAVFISNMQPVVGHMFCNVLE